MDISIVYFTVFAALLHIASCLQCYRCYSSQPGCGKELNIRLQRWHTCPAPGDGGGENFCVKVIEKRGSEQHITRECLMTLRQHTGHRERLPTVQRHGYCQPARQNDPKKPVDNSTIYCMCNDWNGCNSAENLHGKFILSAIFGLFISLTASHLL